MKNRIVIALTGGIGSGKSTVASLFAELGAHIIDADQLARDVVALKQPALEQIVAHFGSSILNEDGTLNRKKLATIIFADQQKREDLEQILHPKIRDAFIIKLKEAPVGAKFILYVVPLYFESRNPFPEVSKVIVVWAPDNISRERIVSRDQITTEEAQQRINAQLPLDIKVSKADWVINNDSSLTSLKPQVEKVFSEIIKLC